MDQKNKYERGIIKTIVIVIIGIVILSYFGIDLEQVSKSDLLKKNLNFTWQAVETGWTNYIYHPIRNLIHKPAPAGTETTNAAVSI